MSTKIEWSDESWNPVVGCTKVSEGCENCYAERMAVRQWHIWKYEGGCAYDKTVSLDSLRERWGWSGEIVCRENILDKPLHWKNPRRIFVCSMSDLFHEKVPFEFIDKVMAVITMCHQHKFQILTKRYERCLEYFKQPELWSRIIPDAISLPLWFNKGVQEPLPGYIDFNAVSHSIHEPLPNLWLGVSVENQKRADERIPTLLQIPAAVRFVSCEPCLEKISFQNIRCGNCGINGDMCYEAESSYCKTRPLHIDWVIIGCESGPKRRPCKLEWVRDLVGQCKAAGVPVFVKQLSINGKVSHNPAEWPEELRVQEYPITKKGG